MNIDFLLTLNNTDITFSTHSLLLKIINQSDNLSDDIKLNTLDYIDPSFLFDSTFTYSTEKEFVLSLQQLALKYPTHSSIKHLNQKITSFLFKKIQDTLSQATKPNIFQTIRTLENFNYFHQYFHYYKEIESQIFSQILKFHHIEKPHDIIMAEKMFEAVKQLNQDTYSLESLEQFWIEYGDNYNPNSIDKDYFSSFTSDFDLSIFFYHYFNSLRAAIANCLFQHFYYHPHEQSSFKHFPHFFQFCDWMTKDNLHYMHVLFNENHLKTIWNFREIDGYHYYVNHFFGVIPQPSFHHLTYLEQLIKKEIDYDILLRDVSNDEQLLLQTSFYDYLKYTYDDLEKLFLEGDNYPIYEEDDSEMNIVPSLGFDRNTNIAFNTLKNVVDNSLRLHLNFNLNIGLDERDDIPKSKI